MARKPDYKKKSFITRVSTELFARRGYQNTSIEHIAHESGYAVGTIYLYFDAKEEILATILSEYVESFLDRYYEEIDSYTEGKDRFRFIAKLFMEIGQEKPDRALVLATELKKIATGTTAIFLNELGKLMDIIYDVIILLKEEGKVRESLDVDQATSMIYGSIETISLWWNSAEEDLKDDLDYVVDQLTDTLLLGVIGK